MAFKQINMQPISNAPVKFWRYWTDDTALTASSRGYFDAFKNNLAVGDWIFLTTSTGGRILHVNEIDPLELDVLK